MAKYMRSKEDKVCLLLRGSEQEAAPGLVRLTLFYWDTHRPY